MISNEPFLFESNYFKTAANNFNKYYEYTCYKYSHLGQFVTLPWVIDLNKLRHSHDENVLKVSIVGCHGEHALSEPKATIQKMIRKDDSQLVISAGDNWYKTGLPPYAGFERFCPEKERFKRDAANYASLNGSIETGLKHKHHFMTLGNHDYAVESDLASLFHTITEGSNPSFSRVISQIEAVKEISNVHLPYRYYAMVKTFPNQGAVIFYVLDSNFLYWDRKQQAFLENTYKILNKHITGPKLNFVIQHHPLISLGKRGGNHPDSKMYTQFLQDEPSMEQEFLKQKYNMGQLYRYYYTSLSAKGVYINAFFAAHDHHLTVLSNILPLSAISRPVWQFVVGGGGGVLQSIFPEHREANKENIVYAEKIYGYQQLIIHNKPDELTCSAQVMNHTGAPVFQLGSFYRSTRAPTA